MNILRHAVLALLFAPLVASAHHGWSEYDPNQTLKLTGTIEEAGYEHPHGYVKLRTPGKTWMAVLAPPSRILSRDALLESALRRKGKSKDGADDPDALVTLREIVRDSESAHIRRVLKACNGHRANAAQTLGISRKNLWEKMKEYGIE